MDDLKEIDHVVEPVLKIVSRLLSAQAFREGGQAAAKGCKRFAPGDGLLHALAGELSCFFTFFGFFLVPGLGFQILAEGADGGGRGLQLLGRVFPAFEVRESDLVGEGGGHLPDGLWAFGVSFEFREQACEELPFGFGLLPGREEVFGNFVPTEKIEEGSFAPE